MILSICIPSYNRPDTLLRLLNSIDENCINDIEVIICEDYSPKRGEIRKVVNSFKEKNKTKLKYIENIINYGFDRNLRELITNADGDFIVFMGDDDYFVRESLPDFISFLKSNPDKGYILKTWMNLHENGWKEMFTYFEGRQYFNPCPSTFISLFRISTFVSGFTFKREYSLPYLIDMFDGTLLFQLYLLGELTLKYPSAYYEVPLTIQTKQKADVPHFGTSASEKDLYTPGKITIENSINFLKGYFKISSYLDTKHNINTTKKIKTEMSKYSYSYLYLHRDKGIKEFYRYYSLLKKEIGLNQTYHTHLYFLALLILGQKNCNNLIFLIKKTLKIS